MAKVKALSSFAGIVTMAKDDVRDITDEKVVKDLVSSGYVEVVEEDEDSKTITKAENQPKSDATTIKELVTDFNALLDKLKTAGVMEADEDHEAEDESGGTEPDKE